MAEYIIQQGDCLSSIAKAHGFDKWQTIYNHPSNADFKAAHPNPNIIFPGETLNIPDLEPRDEKAATDQKHTYELEAEPTKLRIIVQDMDDKPFAGKPYKLTLLDPAAPLKGTTGGDGLIETDVDPAITTGVLEVFIHGETDPPAVWNLLIGALDPVMKKSGHQGRLNNLGFESGQVDGIDGPITQSAVKRFQKKFPPLAVDGVVGSQTRPKLEEIHRC
jgi:Putative peptidoglycan binding domain